MDILTSINWTPLVVAIIGIIGTVALVMLKRALTKYVVPWLDERGLKETAAIVVNAVEAILGRHAGEDKWKMAIEKMKEAGFDVESQLVIDALKAEWYKLDLAMREAGLKENTVG